MRVMVAGRYLPRIEIAIRIYPQMSQMFTDEEKHL